MQTRAIPFYFLCFKKGREERKSWKRLQKAGSHTFGRWLLIWLLTLFSSPRPSESYVFPVFKHSNVSVKPSRAELRQPRISINNNNNNNRSNLTSHDEELINGAMLMQNKLLQAAYLLYLCSSFR